MNTSPAPDVDRVLHRMGRSAFDYRSFPNPVDEAVPSAPGAADAPEDAPPARTFSLVGEALPEAYGADAVPFAPAPAPAPMPTLLAAAMPPANPGAPMAPAPAPRATPLSHMFRILSGLAPAAPSWCDADRQDTGFPFRRR